MHIPKVNTLGRRKKNFGEKEISEEPLSIKYKFESTLLCIKLLKSETLLPKEISISAHSYLITHIIKCSFKVFFIEIKKDFHL